MYAFARKCKVGGESGKDELTEVEASFRGVFGGIVGKYDEKLANRKREPQAKPEKRFLVPFKDILRRYNVPKTIDYLSLDVEGAEYLVMKDFPFDEYRINLLTVERPDDQLKELFQKNGYVYLKQLVWWGETLWAHESLGYTPDHPQIAAIIEETQ
uniref:Methyltransferase FkbM domain-containing protein n=1 Tax=Ditylum brightwellii TaxID=49249 RepID=A0A7S4UXM7_9STRA